MRAAVAVVIAAIAGLSTTARTTAKDVAIPQTVTIPAGPAILGSDAAEREDAYRLDTAAYGHTVTRDQGWYEHETPSHSVDVAAFNIARTPVTNAEYAAFVMATGHAAPNVTAEEWQSYGLIHPFERTRRHAWLDGVVPAGRASHPVVLVSLADATAYAVWLSQITGAHWRLPTEIEWEKAMRGRDGRRFPWGNAFDAQRLNSHDAGPFDTMEAGHYAQGASPYGVLDGAGQVYEWTATEDGPGRAIVKGGSWDDQGCGVCRPAARHSRPVSLKHILIGIRLVRDARPEDAEAK